MHTEDLRLDGRVVAEEAAERDEAAQAALGGPFKQHRLDAHGPGEVADAEQADDLIVEQLAARVIRRRRAVVSACERSPDARNGVFLASSSAQRRTSWPERAMLGVRPHH